MLAVASLAGRAVPVHRRDREELRRLWLALHPVLDVGAADRRSGLGPQRERPVRAIRERVHLLLDDVGARTGGPLEERGVLEDGRRDRPVPVERTQPLDLRRDAPPQLLLRGSDVVCAARTLDLRRPAHAVRSARSSLRNGLPRELVAEGRDRPVARIDDRLGGKRVDEAADRREQRLPVGAREIGAPDRAGEEDVAGEEAAVRVVRDMGRRMAGNREHLERDARDVDRLAAREEHVGRVRAKRDPGRRVARVRASRAACARPPACAPAHPCPRRGRPRPADGRSARA